MRLHKSIIEQRKETAVSELVIDYFRYRTPSPVTNIPKTVIESVYLVFMLEGSVDYIINEENVTIRAGEALCLPVGTLRERPFQATSAKYYSFLLRNVNENDLALIPLLFDYSRNSEILSCLYAIEKAYIARYYSSSPSRPGDRKCIILTELLLNLCANVSEYSSKNPYIDRITEYIRDNYKSKLSIELISHHVHLNPSYCATLFKEETGETIGSFIKKYRLELAKDELERGNTVKVAAESVGFSDQYNFSKWFSKNVGVSPSEYRAKYSLKRKNI